MPPEHPHDQSEKETGPSKKKIKSDLGKAKASRLEKKKFLKIHGALGGQAVSAEKTASRPTRPPTKEIKEGLQRGGKKGEENDVHGGC